MTVSPRQRHIRHPLRWGALAVTMAPVVPIVAIGMIGVLGACAIAPEEGATGGRAESLVHRQLIVDTHIDAPYRLLREAANLGGAAADRQFDYPRARAGGLDVAFMSIYTPASAAEDGTAPELAHHLIDLVEGVARDHPDKFAIATCTRDVELLRDTGVVILTLGMENASPLQGHAEPPAMGKDSLDHFISRGVRYITLAHSRSNAYSDSSYDPDERWQGLSEAGKALVAELNGRGVMIDISHLSDQAAWQVLRRSAAPVIASHSSLRHFVPGFHRNMSDAMVKAMADQGGVIQINFGSGFVSKAARDWSNRASAKLTAELAGQPVDADARRAFYARFTAEHPYPFANLDAVLDHIDRVVEIAGVDHVGLGSDFDGVGDTLPTGLKDVGDYPNLAAGLARRGYSEDEIANILGRNLMRVWRQVEQYAAGHGASIGCRVARRG